MARAFSAKDAKQLIRQHQKLRNQLIDNYNYAERQKKRQQFDCKRFIFQKCVCIAFCG